MECKGNGCPHRHFNNPEVAGAVLTEYNKTVHLEMERRESRAETVLLFEQNAVRQIYGGRMSVASGAELLGISEDEMRTKVRAVYPCL